MLLLASLGGIALASERAPTASQPATRPAAAYPRIAMFWSAADFRGEPDKPDKWANHAMHDVIVSGAYHLGFVWEWHKHHAMVEKMKTLQAVKGRMNLAKIHKLNPAAVVLIEVYFFEEDVKGYPPDHEWWLRDEKGNKLRFWPGTWRCDISNADYQDHVARRIAEVHKAAGGEAGIFLDNLRFEKDSKRAWVSLLTKVRRLCGDEMPILVNAGWDSDDLEWITPLVNGIQYEDAVNHSGKEDPEAFYKRIAQFEAMCRKPHCSVNEVYGKRSDEAAMRREFIRTLVYTNMAFLHADSTHGHKHKWFGLWDIDLGLPAGKPAVPARGTLARRAFEKGLVLWLPASAKAAETVKLDSEHTNAVTSKAMTEVKLQPGEGAVLVTGRRSAARNRILP